MERPRASLCLAIGAIAAAIALVAGGAFEAPRDLSADLSPVAARVVAPPTGATMPPADEGHLDPTAKPSPEPMASDGHGAQPSSPADPGNAHGHGAEASTMPEASDDHGAAPGTHDGDMVGQEPAAGHDDDASGGHEDAAVGHGDEEAAGERPRGVVFGAFFAVNAIALAGAAILRRRDGAAAALKPHRTPVTSPKKDAPR